ncbi:hypothetical protein K504DRAFT_63371 [Pleomassaria siparia CBS 279.74]|uniref:Uncharacterized protein n=1 Tax=Pleomassaria siparia CBS 279.74 TaxID=1314801 RepID=A0A6G1K2F6_9PLEO|nr:hypothetical protein K504DRAFT_63371 [Pleomassaria siparia CBS 279.74]
MQMQSSVSVVRIFRLRRRAASTTLYSVCTYTHTHTYTLFCLVLGIALQEFVCSG